jgi:uncharacterized membrane protein YraQ (UPF0718 family)
MAGSELIWQLVRGGLGNLAAYLAAHVLLCLAPAFYIAGAMSALIPKESVTRFLGRRAPKYVSYPAAAMAGSLLAVCSCTIVPLFAGVYKKGAGLGPAITFLFFAPAANILALAYTGVTIGPDLAFARLFLSLIFGIGIGLIMALIFSRADVQHAQAADTAFAGRGRMKRGALLFLLALVALLLVGTLKLDGLTRSYGAISLPVAGTAQFQAALNLLVPFDASRGEEGVTVQGVVLIGLLVLMAVAAWCGLEKVLDGFNAWTWTALVLTGLTLLAAAVGMVPGPSGLTILLTGKFFGVALALVVLVYLGRRLGAEALRNWLWESWRFVKQIFPLLIAGVFAVGVIRQLIRPEWIEGLAGENTLLGNAAGVLFGVFMYFPTLVEVPIANMFLSLGMHRGPLLAYLMADPELSLQSILIIASIIGRRKAWTYVGWVALFSALAGLLYGAWVDGVSAWIITGALAVVVGLLAALLYLVDRRSRRGLAATPARAR